jgi:hypothetical protein
MLANLDALDEKGKFYSNKYLVIYGAKSQIHRILESD